MISAWWQFVLGLCMGGIGGCIITIALVDVAVRLRDKPEDPDSGR